MLMPISRKDRLDLYFVVRARDRADNRDANQVERQVNFCA